MTLQCATCGGGVSLEDTKQRDGKTIEYYTCPEDHDGTQTIHDDGRQTLTGCLEDNWDY